MLGFNITSVAAAALVISGVLAQKKTVPTCCGAREGFPAQILRCKLIQPDLSSPPFLARLRNMAYTTNVIANWAASSSYIIGEYPQKFNCLNNGFKATCHAAYFDESLVCSPFLLLDNFNFRSFVANATNLIIGRETDSPH